MREYLFELRKKANLSQAEIDVLLRKKYKLKLNYYQIELGYVWKDLSGDRAHILAEILGTTPEYLLKCEKEQGGYIGKNFRAGHTVEHKVRNKRRNEYDVPLTNEEKELAEKYTSYAEKIIDILRCNEYKIFLENSIISYEDFYDIGMIAFLRAIKALTVKKAEGDELLNNLEEPDYFYRHHFSMAVKHAYSKYIRSELSLMRKNYHYALSLDEQADNSDEDDTERYNFLPCKDIPVPITVESTVLLDTLYKYLSEKQIIACKMLISGWTISEIINGKYVSQRDIGVIRFYLLQFKQFGKILWEEKRYKSDETNVSYQFRKNKWQAHLMYKNKNYNLGEYINFNTALDVHTAAQFHLTKGDFPQWHESHMTPNNYTGMAFTYPIHGDEEEINKISLNYFKDSILGKHRGGTEITASTADNPVGVSFNRRRGTYDASISSRKLGSYKKFEEALEIRQEAEAHIKSGDFDVWYAMLKEKRKKDNIPHARINKFTKQGILRYKVERSYCRKLIPLGVYTTEEEALSVKKLADSHIDAGDFDKWAKEYYEKYKAEGKARRSAVKKNINNVN